MPGLVVVAVREAVAGEDCLEAEPALRIRCGETAGGDDGNAGNPDDEVEEVDPAEERMPETGINAVVPGGLSVLLIGFGRFGQVASQGLLARGVDVTIIDTDIEMIRVAADFGFKVYYGDGTRLFRREKLVTVHGLERYIGQQTGSPGTGPSLSPPST